MNTLLFEGRAGEMRRAFDQTFAQPVASAGEPTEELIAIRVADVAYAIRTREITGLVVDRTVVPVPTRAPELLGLVGIRGRVVPVFSLAVLLGHETDGERTRWLALCGHGHSPSVALAFQQFDGHLRVRQQDLRPVAVDPARSEYADEMVATESVVRPLLRIPSLIEHLERRFRRSETVRER